MFSSDTYGTHKYTIRAECRFTALNLMRDVTVIHTKFRRLKYTVENFGVDCTLNRVFRVRYSTFCVKAKGNLCFAGFNNELGTTCRAHCYAPRVPDVKAAL